MWDITDFSRRWHAPGNHPFGPPDDPMSPPPRSQVVPRWACSPTPFTPHRDESNSIYACEMTCQRKVFCPPQKQGRDSYAKFFGTMRCRTIRSKL